MTQRNAANTGWDDVYPNTTPQGISGSYATATGTNALTLTLTPAATKLVVGAEYKFKNTTTNTGNVTLNINGLGVKSVLQNGGTQLKVGSLKAGYIYSVMWDGSNFILRGEGGGEYQTGEFEFKVSRKSSLYVPQVGDWMDVASDGKTYATNRTSGNIYVKNPDGTSANTTAISGWHTSAFFYGLKVCDNYIVVLTDLGMYVYDRNTLSLVKTITSFPMGGSPITISLIAVYDNGDVVGIRPVSTSGSTRTSTISRWNLLTNNTVWTYTAPFDSFDRTGGMDINADKSQLHMSGMGSSGTQTYLAMNLSNGSVIFNVSISSYSRYNASIVKVLPNGLTILTTNSSNGIDEIAAYSHIYNSITGAYVSVFNPTTPVFIPMRDMTANVKFACSNDALYIGYYYTYTRYDTNISSYIQHYWGVLAEFKLSNRTINWQYTTGVGSTSSSEQFRDLQWNQATKEIMALQGGSATAAGYIHSYVAGVTKI